MIVIGFVKIERASMRNGRTGTSDRIHASDKVLQAVDAIMRQVFAKGLAERLRKDEYVATAHAVSKDDFLVLADSVCGLVQTYQWSSIAEGLFVTVSAGAVELHEEEPSLGVIRAIHGSEVIKRRGGNGCAEGPASMPENRSRRLRDYGSD